MSIIRGRSPRARNRHIIDVDYYTSVINVHLTNLSPQKKSTLSSKYYYNCRIIINDIYKYIRLLFCFYVILLFCTFCNAHPRNQRDTDEYLTRNDFVCNVGDVHECVCKRFSGNLDEKLNDCTQYFGVKKLPVLKITLKKINLEDKLHTNETYQQYFRRRVAYLISDYCEHQANDCPGTTLQLTKVDSYFLTETTTQLFLDDYYEPSITQENVIIVRVNFLPRDRVELYVIISKNYNNNVIDDSTTMDPEKIKYILSAQIGPLSRILGGVHIEELRTDYIKKINYESNTGLITMLIFVCIGFIFCYTIAVYRCCMQTRKKRRKQKKNQQRYGPNYGTCTDKLLKYEKPNGKITASSITSKESITSSKKENKNSDAKTPIIELKTPTFEDDKPSLDARSFTRMFACDPSQLPAEKNYVCVDEDVQSEDRLLQSPPLIKKSSSPTTQEGPQIPSMILVSASTPVPHELGELSQRRMEIKSEQQETTPMSSSLLDTGNGYNIYERPLSRRGSRNSTPEEGEEFADDREDTPLPLGDEEDNIFDQDANVTFKSNNINKQKQWSSESDSDHDVYQRLSESSGEEDEKMLKNEEKKSKKFKKITNFSNSSDGETSEDEETGEKTEEEMLNRHTYERLQESPVPTISIPANLLELDSIP